MPRVIKSICELIFCNENNSDSDRADVEIIILAPDRLSRYGVRDSKEGPDRTDSSQLNYQRDGKESRALFDNDDDTCVDYVDYF